MRKIDTESLSKELSELRKQKNLSMDKACKEMELSKPTLSRIEKGRIPDALTLLKMCEWMGVNPIKYLS